MAVLVSNRDQGDVIDKIDIHEEADFSFGKVSFCSEEATVKKPRAGAIDCFNQLVPIVGPEGANLNALPISQCLDGGIFCSVGRDQCLIEGWRVFVP